MYYYFATVLICNIPTLVLYPSAQRVGSIDNTTQTLLQGFIVAAR